MSGPGKSDRRGISLLELTRMFPDDHAARVWFESVRWPNGRRCPRCQGAETHHVEREIPMPYHCKKCRKYFSVRTGTIMSSSKLGLQKWAFGIYLMSTSLKGVSSMKLRRDLGISQKAAWLMGQKIREAWNAGHTLSGKIEVDETYMSDQEKRSRGRPVKYELDPINAPAIDIARAIFEAVEKQEQASDDENDPVPV